MTSLEYLEKYWEALDHQLECGTSRLCWPYSEIQPIYVCPWCDQRKDIRLRYSFAVPTQHALEVIAQHSPHGVVEIGAGLGYWAYELQRRGVDVAAYDAVPLGHRLPSGDLNYYEWYAWRPWTEVGHADHVVAAEYPRRTLLMCWPEDDLSWPAQAVELYQGDTIIYVGEGPYCSGGHSRVHDLLGITPVISSLFEIVCEVTIPCWSGFQDRLTVHKRSMTHGRVVAG